MYDKEVTRIASSQLESFLFGDISRYQTLLRKEQKRIQNIYPDSVILDSMFGALDSRIINICPMVLCDAVLSDLGLKTPDDLLAGLGLAMFSISTHDDLVDELPANRVVVAGLTYSGNIATLEGISILLKKGYVNTALVILDYMNKNHYYQTKIASTLWREPSDENGYLKAISHTKYWAAIGLKAAVVFAERNDLHVFADAFAECYGTTCQLFDDMREIKDDIQNGYWSLPISLARENNWDLEKPEFLNLAIQRSRELAEQYLDKAKRLCGESFPHLLELVRRIEETGRGIVY